MGDKFEYAKAPGSVRARRLSIFKDRRQAIGKFRSGLKSIKHLYLGGHLIMSNMERGCCIGAGFDTAISLLIIGNGFDLHHGLATSYSDYHKWLKVHDKC